LKSRSAKSSRYGLDLLISKRRFRPWDKVLARPLPDFLVAGETSSRPTCPRSQELFSAYISSAKKHEAHPRKALVRALHHRGAKVFATEGEDLRMSANAPARPGWVSAKPLDYPQEQEEASVAKSAAAY